MNKRILSERAKHRLRIAAAAIRADGVKIDCSRDQFYEKIQEILVGLPQEKQEKLKAQVDWVEDYDRYSSDFDLLLETKKPSTKKIT